MPGPKRWLIFGVSLISLVESSDLFFLEARIIDQWDKLKNMWQIRSYDDMFLAFNGFDHSKILKIRILSKKFLENEGFFSFSLKCFNLNCTPRIDTTTKIAWHHLYCSKDIFSKKIVCLILNSRDNEIFQPLANED